MKVELLLPAQGMVDVADLPAWVNRGHSAPPFDASVVNACADLSQRILRAPEARRYPELLALAFWIRKAEIHRLREEFGLLSRPDRILVPRGMVFHFPPRYVDTMFVYSWLLSVLPGTRKVIRLSPRRSESTKLLLRPFGAVIAAVE